MTLTESFDPLALRRVFAAFPTGVAALAAVVDERPYGIAVGSFTAVSLEPAMVLVCVAHTSTTWPVLAQAPRLGISVLAVHQEQAFKQLSERHGDRFTGLDWHATSKGALLLDGASAWFECSVDQRCRAGDHDIVVLRVHDLAGDHTVSPLIFHGSRLRRLHPEPPPDNPETATTHGSIGRQGT
jgi:flavin reductase (DIM6/NTAB) family NADH-FMN oxidoreductase RutF